MTPSFQSLEKRGTVFPMIGKISEPALKISNDWKNQPFDVAVVGAGPAGLMAAMAAARTGAKVIVCEQMERPGLKLLSTGGGRCNLTNTASLDDFIARFGRQGRFMRPALEAMPANNLRSFFEEQHVPTVSPDGFHVYPASQSAGNVLQALLHAMEGLRVKMLTGVKAIRLGLDENLITGLETDQGQLKTRRIILACGGQSYSKLGGTGGGYALAQQAGHKLVEPIPALVPLLTKESWPGKFAGTAMAKARLRIDLKGFPREGVVGDVLLTHRGISGPVVLDLSAEIAQILRRQPEVPLRIAVTPDISATEWAAQVDQWRSQEGRKQIFTLLDQKLPASLAEALCLAADVPRHLPASQISADQRTRLCEALTALPLTIIGTEGFEHAMVTRGGVSLREVDPQTLESRLIPGLYFAGELLDLDGPCGGYNLQWAFSSGYLAGRCAGKA
jgi:predicted Rossmann fold flavoprotein